MTKRLALPTGRASALVGPVLARLVPRGSKRKRESPDTTHGTSVTCARTAAPVMTSAPVSRACGKVTRQWRSPCVSVREGAQVDFCARVCECTPGIRIEAPARPGAYGGGRAGEGAGFAGGRAAPPQASPPPDAPPPAHPHHTRHTARQIQTAPTAKPAPLDTAAAMSAPSGCRYCLLERLARRHIHCPLDAPRQHLPHYAPPPPNP